MTAATRKLIAVLRDAEWLGGQRACVYGCILAAGLLAMTVWLSVAPLRAGIQGGDFVSFYAASRLAMSGHAADVWRPELHAAAEQAVLGGSQGYLAFLYPPPYLLVCWGLALLPFQLALLVWITGSTGAAWLSLTGLFGRTSAAARTALLLLLALPATSINSLAGQNGALSLAVLAAGFACLDRRPRLGGALLGLMVMKPQLAIMVPIILIAAGRWRAFVAMVGAAVMFMGLAWAAVGNDGYAAFFGNIIHAKSALEGAVDPALVQSMFASLQSAGPLAAYVGQGALAVVVITIVIAVTRRTHLDGFALAALTGAATVAATPFLLDYDLAIEAIPIGWIVVRGAKVGFRPWEKMVCLACGVLPLFSRALAINAHLQLSPLLSVLLLTMVVRRCLVKGAKYSAVGSRSLGKGLQL